MFDFPAETGWVLARLIVAGRSLPGVRLYAASGGLFVCGG